jgi:hypothetical protein
MGTDWFFKYGGISFTTSDQDPELESLSDWVRTIRSLVQGRIHKLKNCVNSRPKSVFKDQEAVKYLYMIYIQTRYCWKPCPQER